MPTKLTLEWSAAAQDDFLAIVDFISDDSPQAALDLVDEIVEKVNLT
jgi:toxin ParE1/3/4